MLTVEFSGEAELRKKLDALIDPDLITGILDEAEAILLNRIRTRFLDETDPDGTPWIPSGAGASRRASGGTGTLFNTGTLFHSIQEFASGDDERAIGTDVPYAPKLQFGTEGYGPWVFLGFGDGDISVVEKLVLLRVEEVMS